jgi:glutathione S-transferase
VRCGQYWKIRGIGGAIRLLLTYTGEEFEEVLYEQGDSESGYSRHEWLDVKETLGLPFPNLPWLKDGDLMLTHSVAIMRYIARKHSLLGATPAEEAKADMVAMEVRGLTTGRVDTLGVSPPLGCLTIKRKSPNLPLNVCGATERKVGRKSS